ncbi:peptidoglycan-binding domain-containing protein [uncultured Cohaesibacter sp.]|uniref:peptidoglycan-binding domain-containing protein n=1 Tax=uncultured Cohaesibacter sp. TaxID=1002546 RepID=UPI0029C6519F|nr:peptidoglycan-binding domain-containing protein [uncultured Cohaesibacter sp.]
MIETDENGFVAIRLDNQFIGGNCRGRHQEGGQADQASVSDAERRWQGETIEALDPADAHIDLVIGQDERTCRSGKSCAFSISVSNTGNGIYEGPVFIEGALQGDWIMAAIQLGLSRMGYQPGRADGIDGPKTQNAIASFLQQQRLEAPGNNEQLFEMLYQYPFRKLARLGISDKTNCIRIALAKPASPVYRARQPAPAMRQDLRQQNRNTREEAIGRALGLGLSIGIGILNNRHSREPRRPRYDGPME